jgi:O-antigen ligase
MSKIDRVRHPPGAGLRVGKSSLMLGWYGLIAVTMVTGLGAIENALLLATAAAMFAALARRPVFPVRQMPIIVCFALLFLYYAVLTVMAPGMRGVANTLGVFVSAMFFFFSASRAQRVVSQPDAAWALVGVSIVSLTLGLASGAVAKNSVSGVCAYPILTAGLIWIARGAPPVRTAALVFAAIGAIGVILGHRMMAGVGILAMLVFLTVWFAPAQVARNLVLAALTIGVVLLIGLYARLWGLDIREFDSAIRDVTGRTAASGRHIIWPAIIEAAQESPWTGLGTGKLYSDIALTSFSAHNYFLQIYLQTGFVGVVLLVAVLLAVWRAIGRPQRDAPESIYVSACFAVVLVHSSLEVFLMQANPTIGGGAWIMLGLGVGLSAGRRPRRALDAAAPSTPIRFGRSMVGGLIGQRRIGGGRIGGGRPTGRFGQFA